MALTATIPSGVPYGSDIRRLRDAWPVPRLREDVLIPHQELEGILNYKRGSHRYYGVISAWIRRELNENGIFMAWQPGEGVKVLNPADRFSHGEKTVRFGFKKTRRGIRTIGGVDRNRLDETGQRRYDHQMTVLAKLKGHIDASRKEMAIDIAPVQSLPRPKLIDKAG